MFSGEGREGVREGKSSVLEVSVDDAVVMEIVSIKDKADDGDGVMLGKLVLWKDTIKELSR